MGTEGASGLVILHDTAVVQDLSTALAVEEKGTHLHVAPGQEHGPVC